MAEGLIPMVEVVHRFLAAGWSEAEIAEALARTSGGEDELAVVEEILARRTL